MTETTFANKLALSGMTLGALALLLGLIHFWAGPFTPQPSLEQVVAEKAVAIRDATVAALKGESIPAESKSNPIDLDRVAMTSVAVMGGLAIIFGLVAFVLHAPKRAAFSSVALGLFALAYQFAMLALGLLVLVILIGAVLGELDFSL